MLQRIALWWAQKRHRASHCKRCGDLRPNVELQKSLCVDCIAEAIEDLTSLGYTCCTPPNPLRAVGARER